MSRQTMILINEGLRESWMNYRSDLSIENAKQNKCQSFLWTDGGELTVSFAPCRWT